jgi:ribosome-associated protein
MKTFKITGAFIQLNQLIKAAGWVSNGAEANNAIDRGLVKVNNKVELRKRNKLVIGNKVEFNSQTITIE